ncbi:MAG TPA: hypothetical protein VME21_12745 [Steroidobacteraceae bacterium]|nr:hypothetical protein [Steroidobacteraceae bacterium]
MAVNHTFIYEPGVWTLTGMFWSADGLGIAVDGRTEISHGRDCWMLAGRMRVLATPPAEFVNIYNIEIPGRGALSSKWTSENSTLGRLHGVFTVIGPSILSMYRSDHGGYQGTEHLRQISPDEYEGFGALLMDDKRLSSWQVTLRR